VTNGVGNYEDSNLASWKPDSSPTVSPNSHGFLAPASKPPIDLTGSLLALLAKAQNLTDSQINLVSARLVESAQRPCVFTKHRQNSLLTPSFLPPVGS